MTEAVNNVTEKKDKQGIDKTEGVVGNVHPGLRPLNPSPPHQLAVPLGTSLRLSMTGLKGSPLEGQVGGKDELSFLFSRGFKNQCQVHPVPFSLSPDQ